MTKTKPKPKPKKPTYKLTVQIGKKRTKDKVLKFATNDPVKSLLSIKIPKVVEGVIFTLEKDGKVAQRRMLSFQARRVFENKLNAFFLIKNMHYILK